MIEVNETPGSFCWLDLATTDEPAAQAFYRDLFGWSAQAQPANGGSFTRLQLAGRDVGSVYQLNGEDISLGVPSHWTPYVQVADAAEAAARAEKLGGRVIVRPVVIEGAARIALIADPGGAHLGLWESIPACLVR